MTSLEFIRAQLFIMLMVHFIDIFIKILYNEVYKKN